jgi:hypothetical protein
MNFRIIETEILIKGETRVVPRLSRELIGFGVAPVGSSTGVRIPLLHQIPETPSPDPSGF